jgi:hypothetical protein
MKKQLKEKLCKATINGEEVIATYAKLKKIARVKAKNQWIHGTDADGEFAFYSTPDSQDICRAVVDGVKVEADYLHLKEYAYGSQDGWIYGEDSQGAFGFCTDPDCTCDRFMRYG